MRRRLVLIMLILVTAAAAFIIPASGLSFSGSLNWGIISAVLAVLIIAALFLEFESAAAGSKEIALIAILGTVSAVLRVPFAAIPSVQPCTYLIICTGYVFGPIAGFTVGAVTALVSNFFLGLGPWTPYQMIAWGFAGLSAGFLKRRHLNSLVLMAFGILWGYLYGLITNLWFWTAFVYPLTPRTLLITELNSIWFDTLHAVSNAVFLGIMGAKTIAILERFKKRFSINISRTSETELKNN